MADMPDRDAEMLGDPGSVDYYVRQLEDALRQRNAECRALRSEKAALVEVVEASRACRDAMDERELHDAQMRLDAALNELDAAIGGAHG